MRLKASQKNEFRRCCADAFSSGLETGGIVNHIFRTEAQLLDRFHNSFYRYNCKTERFRVSIKSSASTVKTIVQD